MSVASAYVSDWRERVGRAVQSYRETRAGLVGAREHYYTRPHIVPGDKDEGGRGWCIEIPLLWGAF